MKITLAIFAVAISTAIAAPQYGPSYVVSAAGGPTYTVSNSQRGFSIETGGAVPKTGAAYVSQTSSQSSSAAYAAQQAAAAQAAAEQAAAQRAAAEQAAAQRAAADQAAAQRAAAEQAAAQRAAAEQAAALRAASAQRTSYSSQSSSQRTGYTSQARPAISKKVSVVSQGSQIGGSSYTSGSDAGSAFSSGAGVGSAYSAGIGSGSGYTSGIGASGYSAGSGSTYSTGVNSIGGIGSTYTTGVGAVGGLTRGAVYPNVYIIRQSQDQADDGSAFNYAFEADNGITLQATGAIKAYGPQPDDIIQSMQGSYSYIGDDGQTYTVNYIADENGFQPTGAHLHPIPDEIARSIQYNLSNPPHPDTLLRK